MIMTEPLTYMSYYDRLIGSRIRAFDWYKNQRPWND